MRGRAGWYFMSHNSLPAVQIGFSYGESLTFVRIRVAQLAAIIGLTTGDEMEFDHLGDGMLRVRKASE